MLKLLVCGIVPGFCKSGHKYGTLHNLHDSYLIHITMTMLMLIHTVMTPPQLSIKKKMMPQVSRHCKVQLSLTLPGKILNMSALILQKKICHTGNKVEALKGWEMLQNDGIGWIHEQKAIRGTDKVAS